MSGLRSVTFRCQGHADIRGTHRKTVEFTRDTEITGRATCVLGVAANFDPHSMIGFRGPVAITVTAGARTAVLRAVANPGFEPSASLVVRTSTHSTPNTIAVAADAGAADLDRELVGELGGPSVTVTVTVAELPAPSRPDRGELTVLSVPGSGLECLTAQARHLLSSADAVLTAQPKAAREVLSGAGERVSLQSPAHVDLPARFRAGERLVYLAVQGGPEDDGFVGDLGVAAVETGAAVRILPSPSLETAARMLSGAGPYLLLGTSGQARGARAEGLRAAAAAGVPAAWRDTPSTVEEGLDDIAAVLGTRPVRLWISPASTQGWVLRGSAADVREQWNRTGRPPCDLVLLVTGERPEGEAAAGAANDEVDDLLGRLLDEGVPARTLAQARASAPGRDYRSEYRRVLRVKTDRGAIGGPR